MIRRVALCAVAFGSSLAVALGLRGLILAVDPLASSALTLGAVGVGSAAAVAVLWLRSGQPDRLRVAGAFIVPAIALAASLLVAPIFLALALAAYLASGTLAQAFSAAGIVMTLVGAIALVRARAISVARSVLLVLLSLAGIAAFAPIGVGAQTVSIGVAAPVAFGFASATAVAAALVVALVTGAWAALMFGGEAERGQRTTRSLT